MIIRKALSSSAWCSNCRLTLLKAFISSSSLLVPPTGPNSYSRVGCQSVRLSAGFTTSRSWHSGEIQQHPSRTPAIEERDELDAGAPTAKEGEHTETKASIPWYLKIETPQRQSNPLLDRQQLPPLPPDPPPLLKPMLEHISIDLGLDDLTLLDLRKIDPPPALGAKLLMIIGTARSEKHLHVSADRFRRWLKVTHGLSPYADGLLGRGELKLKLRRKNRRAKLLSNVGASETRPVDDGIRTGWICVNVGTIEDGKDGTESHIEPEGYVGFGSEATGAKVVIQMLTQEKREELDLEGLWGKVIRRHERKEEQYRKDQSGEEEVRQVLEAGQHLDSGHRVPFFPTSSRGPTIHNNQVRQSQRHYSSSSTAQSVSRDSESELVIPGNRKLQPEQDLSVLRGHLVFLKGLPVHFAINALGDDAMDQKSTTFLQSFYGVLPHPPSAAHRECLWDLVSYGYSIRHPGYRRHRILRVFEEVQSLVDVELQEFLRIAEFLFSPMRSRSNQTYLTRKSFVNGIDLLANMQSHGYDIHTADVRGMMQRAVRLVFGDCGKIGAKHPHELKLTLDDLQARLGQSPAYPACLRLLIECCEEMQSEEGYWETPPKDEDQGRKIFMRL